MKKFLSLLMTVMVMLAFSGLSFAQDSGGHGFLQLTTNVDSVTVGGQSNIPFTYFLTNGTAGQSDVIIANSSFLSQHGINVILINSSGTPTYNGVVEIYATSSAVPGSYSVPVTTGGADPGGTVVVQLNVTYPPPTTAPSTTINQSSSAATTQQTTQQSTLPSSTVPATQSSGGNTSLVLIAVLVVIVIAIIAIVLLRGRKS